MCDETGEDIYALTTFGDLHPPLPPSLHQLPVINNKNNMASIVEVDSTSSFSQGEGPSPPPHQSMEELMVWFSSVLHVRPQSVEMQTSVFDVNETL